MNLIQCTALVKYSIFTLLISLKLIIFRCGSTEHKLQECRNAVYNNHLEFAKCFICNEEGHLSRQCPDNPMGLYPNGGACR